MPTSRDKNYCHGTINDYDLTVFSRKNRNQEVPDPIGFSSWTVIAIHLKAEGFPHLVLNSKMHTDVFYKSLVVRFPTLRMASAILNQYNRSASQYFDLFIKPDLNAYLSQILDDELLQQLIMRFSRYDVELDDNMLYVFKEGEPKTARELKNMLAEALWLAEKIENRAYYASPVAAHSV